MIRKDNEYTGKLHIHMRMHACYWRKFPISADWSQEKKIATALEHRGACKFTCVIPISSLLRLYVLSTEWCVSWFNQYGAMTHHQDPYDDAMHKLLRTYAEESGQVILESGPLPELEQKS
jgi:hypothetical protein